MAKIQVAIYIEPEDWRAVLATAHDEGISAAEYIRRLVRRSLAQKRAD